MPHGFMNLPELACFIGMDIRHVERMAQRGEIPCQKVSGQFRFNRAEITEWLQQRMVSSPETHMESTDAGMTAQRQTGADEAIVTPLLCQRAVAPNLAARTRKSVLKELVALAQETELVYDAETLLEALEQREELCSTAMEEGVAMPHPRRPLPYAIAEPILVVGHTSQGIGFGAPDGRLTDLFFMTCSKDDRHHLHVLARLCRMLHGSDLAVKIREAAAPEEIVDLMRQRELDVIAESA
jgi:nitrogen PTS system EIIA component